MKDCTNCGHKIEGYALCPIVDECDDVLSKWIPKPTNPKFGLDAYDVTGIIKKEES